MIRRFTTLPALLGITALSLIGCGAPEEEKPFQAVHEDGSVFECTGFSADSCKYVSGPAAESEALYAQEQAEKAALDTGVAGFKIVESSDSMIVSENGTEATFTVSLTSEPTGSVELILTSGDETEVSIVGSSQWNSVNQKKLYFSGYNWHEPQTVTVKGVADCIGDSGSTSPITVAIDKWRTSDSRYKELNS
jgi:hypothetical protein